MIQATRTSIILQILRNGIVDEQLLILGLEILLWNSQT